MTQTPLKTEIPKYEPLPGRFWLHGGQNSRLSLLEAGLYAKKGAFHPISNILEISEAVVVNPRQIPRKSTQLFLDRLGGAKMLTRELFSGLSFQQLGYEVLQMVETHQKETKLMLYVGGIEAYASDTARFLRILRENMSPKAKKGTKMVNIDGKKWETGKLFGEKVLKKGLALQIWAKEDGYSLGRIEAIQNIRNYTLRDHKKPFRDPRMGMLPPKLAQMMVNLAFLSVPQEKRAYFQPKIVDPFCGSGTVNVEAAILGLETEGSDINGQNTAGSQENWAFLSQKFRFEKESGRFFTADASKRTYKSEKPLVVVTEGYLGTPMRKIPQPGTIFQEKKHLLALWESVFEAMATGNVSNVIMCVPAWRKELENNRFYSIANDILALAAAKGFLPLQKELPLLRYARKEAIVAREVLILEKKK